MDIPLRLHPVCGLCRQQKPDHSLNLVQKAVNMLALLFQLQLLPVLKVIVVLPDNNDNNHNNNNYNHNKSILMLKRDV